MRETVKNPIPLITADLITACSMIAALNANGALRRRCRVVQAIADHGKSVDELTVGELLQMVREAQKHVH